MFQFFVNLLTGNFLATKLVLYALFVFVLPIVLHNLWVNMVSEALGWVFSHLSGYQAGVSVSGLTAWFFEHLRLGEALQILLNLYVVRVIIQFIKP